DADGVINISQMTLPFTPGTECYGNSSSSVLVYADCSTVGDECLAALRTTSVSDPKTIDNFPVEAGQTYIIVMSTSLAGTDASICFEFDFNFTGCPNPDDISYEDLTDESVSFSWNNPLDMADEWEYTVIPASAGEPTGSGITSSTNSDNIISGLDPDTDYNFYIRSICSGARGDSSSPFPFRTLSTVKNMPYFTDFTTGSTEGSERCCNVMDLNHDNVTWDFLGGWDGIVDAYASI